MSGATPRATSLEEYYANLLRWENEECPHPLVETWPTELVRLVCTDFRKAVTERLLDKVCRITRGSTNQSIGNQVEDCAVRHLAGGLRHFEIGRSGPAGYPDRNLAPRGGGQVIAFEVKATHRWDAKNWQRRVLTASSRKLRSEFQPPVRHLLCTVIYEEVAGKRSDVRVKRVRLDFLEPSTIVDVRLEASVSHGSLEDGSHRSCVIPP